MGRWRGLQPWMAAALVAAAAAIWLATAHFQIIDRLQFVGTAPMRPVSTGHELVQTIKAPADNISRIDLLLSKPAPGVGGNMKIQLVEVKPENGGSGIQLGEPLREVSFDTESLDYTVISRFGFEPVTVRPGAEYGFRLTSDDPEDIGVQAGAGPGSEYTGGRLFIDGEPTEADLYFAIYHSNGSGGLLEKVEPFRPFPFSSMAFYIAVFIIAAGAFGWLLWMMAGGAGDAVEPGRQIEKEGSD